MKTYIEVIMIFYAASFAIKIVGLCVNAYPLDRKIYQWEGVVGALIAAAFFFWGYSVI